jgi:hypothetical protein
MMKRISFPLCLVVLASFCSEVAAQSLVINGLYDCQRATNGRAYCKRQGAPNGSAYAPVSEEFFNQYEAARTGRPTQPAVATPAQAPEVVNQSAVNQSATSTTNNVVIVNLTAEASDIKGQMAILQQMLSEQKALAKQTPDDSGSEASVKEIEARLDALKSTFHDKTVELSKYQTSIKPDDADLQISARRESEIQTKIPYYIPGTKESGEFWVEPVVSDEGALQFKFQFVDVESEAANKIRSSITMDADQLEKTKNALLKTGDDSKKAHEKGIRREFALRLTCFPDADCPPEGQKIAGKASTEVLFEVHEDGSTNARIQRNKGLFEEGYNLSVGSALLLQSYINHVLVTGKNEHEMGSATTEKLKELFK